jgi:hypothetical protein
MDSNNTSNSSTSPINRSGITVFRTVKQKLTDPMLNKVAYTKYKALVKRLQNREAHVINR